MKNLLLTLLAAAAFAGTASANVSIQISTAGQATITIADGSGLDTVGFAGTVGYNNGNYGGWRISGITGVSNSPSNFPVGLDLSSLTATCFASASPCSELTAAEVSFHTWRSAFT